MYDMLTDDDKRAFDKVRAEYDKNVSAYAEDAARKKAKDRDAIISALKSGDYSMVADFILGASA